MALWTAYIGKSVSIVPGTSDEWMLTAVVTLAYDALGHVALLTQDVDIYQLYSGWENGSNCGVKPYCVNFVC